MLFPFAFFVRFLFLLLSVLLEFGPVVSLLLLQDLLVVRQHVRNFLAERRLRQRLSSLLIFLIFAASRRPTTLGKRYLGVP